MLSLLSANRLAAEVNGYEYWIPSSEIIAHWEQIYGGVFYTRPVSEQHLILGMADTENDEPIGPTRFLVPVVRQSRRFSGRYELLRNEHGVKSARIKGSDSTFTVLCLDVIPM